MRWRTTVRMWTRAALQRHPSTLLTPILCSVAIFSAAAQTPTRPPLRLTPNSPGMQGAPRLAPTNQDLFNALIGSAASIDMDSPVAARVEFDPPVVPLGGRSVYRIVLNALDESVKLPDQLPSSEGLQLQAGGRGQAYQHTGLQKL